MRDARCVHRLIPAALVVFASACASDPPPQPVAPAEEQKGLSPMTPDELRTAWAPLARDEATLADDLSALSTLSPDERMRRLTRMRDGAGILSAGLARLRPSPELAACRDTARDGAAALKVALDGIHELWMGRSRGGRSDADRLAASLCEAFAKMAMGRDACGVKDPVPVPASCKP